ncbi:MAG: hypothetical protein AAGA68_24185 [Pseudomonadota bacterium]
MDKTRRGILKGSIGAFGAVGLPLSAGADGRLYGVPVSVTGTETGGKHADLLRLQMARANVPTAVWDEVLLSGELWANVLLDADETKKFRADPDQYLLDAGIDPSLMVSSHSEVQVLRAITDQGVLEAAAKGDYQLFAQTLRDTLSTHPVPSVLKWNLVQYFERNRKQIEGTIQRIKARADALGEPIEGDVESLTDLRRLQQLVGMPLQGTGISEVSVLIDFVVNVNFGVISIAAVLVLVVAGAGVIVAIDIPGPISDKMNNRLANLDPELIRDFDQAVQVAAMLGQENFIVDAAKEVIDVETEAVLDAFQEVGIVQIDEKDRAEAVALLQKFSYQRAGLVN